MMINEGVLENPKVDKILALHVYPSMDVGKWDLSQVFIWLLVMSFILLLKEKVVMLLFLMHTIIQ